MFEGLFNDHESIYQDGGAYYPLYDLFIKNEKNDKYLSSAIATFNETKNRYSLWVITPLEVDDLVYICKSVNMMSGSIAHFLLSPEYTKNFNEVNQKEVDLIADIYSIKLVTKGKIISAKLEETKINYVIKSVDDEHIDYTGYMMAKWPKEEKLSWRTEVVFGNSQ